MQKKVVVPYFKICVGDTLNFKIKAWSERTIYEVEIKYISDKYVIMEKTFSGEEFCINLHSKLGIFYKLENSTKVIGNIHQNPELLEQE